ncbi:MULTISPECIES: DNA-binding protein [unclassified Endozoicomonas]|uniref:FitA-like ribbon-helix-helix domain-containing protein n=1 Tax=unclassified Endozoicomonas TaxID=2644528 RepID=UPI00214815CD|nr:MULTISPECIES: DNA-binding protein [unclassified Endozoicomonas]
MANLLVRNIDEAIVDALKAQAGKHGRSAEAEHRKILEAALLRPRNKNFTEALKNIPDVGSDTDFERINDEGDRDVFN